MQPQEVINSLSDLISHKSVLEDSIKRLEVRLESEVKKRDAFQLEVYYASASIEVFSYLIEKVSEGPIQKMMDLINEAVAFIMDDRQITISFEVNDMRNMKTLEFFVTEVKGEEIIKSSLSDSNGEGLRTIVGLMIIHFYLEVSKGIKLIVLDEAVSSSVADQYLINLFTFLKQLGERGGFTYLMIEHDPRIESLIDQRYIMNQGFLKRV